MPKTIHLGDDGTMDTVLFCSECKEEFRFNFDPTSCEDPVCEFTNECSHYDEFVEESIAEIEDEHDCTEEN